METTPAQLEVDNELRAMTAEQIRSEKAAIASQLRSLQDQIGDLAFNNYRTYADAGRTTELCTGILTEMSGKLSAASAEIPAVAGELRAFFTKTRELENELAHLRAASDPANPLWDILSLPNRMDVCIRAGFYEAAYSLTNYGVMLQQHGMTKNPVIKEVADKLVASRAFLLEELFNKFAGPIDLTTSIQVVNNIRKMPYLSPTQLRVAILHYRDVYLDKQIMEIATESEAAFKAVEIFRDSMYDTMVLYLAVFPESEVLKKDPSRDPRWEPWPAASPQAILGEWATRNVEKLLEIISNTEFKSTMELATLFQKLLSFGQSFGRMGLDFRPKVVHVVHTLALKRFKGAVKNVTNKLVAHSRLDIVSGSVHEMTAGEAGGVSTADAGEAPPAPGAELSLWDDICVYGNGIVEALNDLRNLNSPVLLRAVRSTLVESLHTVAEWMGARAASAAFPRAVTLFATQLVPFFESCLKAHFPYAAVAAVYGPTHVARQQYTDYIHMDVLTLFEGCSNAEEMERVAGPLLKKKPLPNVEDVLKNTEKKEEGRKETALERPDPVQQTIQADEQMKEGGESSTKETDQKEREIEKPVLAEGEADVKFVIEDEGGAEGEEWGWGDEHREEQEEQTAERPSSRDQKKGKKAD